MEKNKFNFTDHKLTNLKPVTGKNRSYFYDTKTDGLRLQITTTGTKTFQFQTWDQNRKKPVTRTLGKYPSLPIQEARQKAISEMSAVNNNIDIEEAAKNTKEEDTFSHIFHRWIEEHAKLHKKSWKDDTQRYRLYIEKPFGQKRLSWFTQDKVRKWHYAIKKMEKQRGKGTVTGSTANRTLTLITTVFNQMVPDRPNPCRGVKKFREKSRDRFLQPLELQRFFETLETPETPIYLRDYLLISIFTGARRGNIMSMRWSDIDLEQYIWKIPADQSKNSEPMTIPLVGQVIEILRNRKKSTRSVFVFHSPLSKSGHLEEPKKAWASLLKRANLKDVRLHDLRRTLGSYQTMTGASTTIVGKTLGHKSHAATAVYARLNLDPVRASMELAVEMMLASKELPEKIIKMRE